MRNIVLKIEPFPSEQIPDVLKEHGILWGNGTVVEQTHKTITVRFDIGDVTLTA